MAIESIELAEAYVHIIPSAKGMGNAINKEMGNEVEAAGKEGGAKFSNAFGGFLAGTAKMTAAAVAVAATGVGAITTKAVQGAADFEQLWGGVQKLYGASGQSLEEYAAQIGKTTDAAQAEYSKLQRSQMDVLVNAKEAYKTAGIDMNTYMERATSFSASLISSLGGDTEEAARLTDIAMRGMSDNANTFGTDIESISNAYMGFSKQNYTMLDNLKLGFGGTKEEMQRLIKEASEMTDVQDKLGLSVDASSMSFDNIVSAIEVMQEHLKIAGTTENEAATTVSGSLNMMQAAWTNFVSELAMGSGDLSDSIDALIESGLTFLGNVEPVIETALSGIAFALGEIAPVIGERLPAIISSILPSLIEAVTKLLSALAQALPGMITTLLSVVGDLAQSVMQILMDNLPMLTEVALQAVATLANGLAEAAPTMIPQIVDLVLNIADSITNNADLLIDSALALMLGLADGLSMAIPQLRERAPEIVLKLAGAIIDNLPEIIIAGTNIILALATGIIKGWANLIKVGVDAVNKVGEGFKGVDVKQWGKDLVDNFISGIKANWEKFKNAVKGLADTVHDYIGFSEPKKGPLSNFHTYAPDMVDLFAKGVKDSESVLTDQLNESLSLPVNMGINATAAGGGNTSIAPTINVYGTEGQDVNELAEVVMDKINSLVYKQGAVYA